MGNNVRQFAGLAGRSNARVMNNLGIISTASPIIKTFRRQDLDLYDAYYESRQYAGLQPWDKKCQDDGTYIPVRDRQPRLIYNFAKVLASRLASKLVGKRNFPAWRVEDDPDTEEFFRFVIQSSNLRAKLVEPVRRSLNSGSVFVRFSLVNGSWKIEHFLSKWCFPEFDANQQLKAMEIKYVFEDKEDLDEKGLPKKKWFKMDLGPISDILYDTPDFSSDDEPEFKVLEVAEHKLGFVQGEWFMSSDEANQIDGAPLIGEILPFIDEINYSLSQTSQSVAYNQDPQLTLKGMDDEEIQQLVRSAQKAWNMGKNGEAGLLEASLSGPEMAIMFRDKVRLSIQDISRIVMLDPEKMVASAQSGKSMEVLHGPMVELVEELQPQYETHMKNLLIKMGLTILIQNQRLAPVPVFIPPGFQPKSMNLTANFPSVFPQTIEDLQKKVSVASSVTNASIISRETATKWLAKDFGVEDIDEELSKIASQPVINPFGAF